MNSSKQKQLDLRFRAPKSTDGAQVHQLIENCPPLDTNSMYCNLVQCTHFADTSVAVTLDDEMVGFISGHLIPERPDTLFIWQVAVSKKARGQGLAGRMTFRQQSDRWGLAADIRFRARRALVLDRIFARAATTVGGGRLQLRHCPVVLF